MTVSSPLHRMWFLFRRCVYLVASLAFASATMAQSIDSSKLSEALQSTAKELVEKRQVLDQILWGPELMAQQYEATFVGLWDRLREAEDKFQELDAFAFENLLLGDATATEQLDLGIRQTRFATGATPISRERWRGMLAAFKASGYRILQTEWHHENFRPPAEGQNAGSQVRMVAHVAREGSAHRVILRALLDVEWSTKLNEQGNPVPENIAVVEMQMLDRHAEPIFEEVFSVKSSERYPRLMPLLVYDLDGDGLSEVVLAGANMVLRNQGAGNFKVESFLTDERSIFDGAVLADFTGDGHVDFVAVDTEGYPLLFVGDAEGRFGQPGRRMADTHLSQPKAFTAGDVDGDGDLDLFIANYKYPYRQGQVPTPYFDANDGFPAYLLRNDGEGNFSDVTEASGLGPKRLRRTFSTSFVDLDDDRDMDLVVVSDYSGLDVYLNDGKGMFTDVSDRLKDKRHFFGMGHTFGDYDLDGKLDLYVIGMSSTTARRLENLGLGRPDKPEHNAQRAAMGYGNRMFLRQEGNFTQAPFNDSVARTGWSWGATSFDFDNDGDKDIFVANGHVSGQSSQDYCSTFWRHDIYEQGSEPNLARDVLFQVESTDLRQANISWNGYEHKALMMNLGGKDFVNVAFLLGASFEYDGRAAVTDDLDGDGRMDLLVVEFKSRGVKDGRDMRDYILHVYKNAMPEPGHWIGVRLKESGPGWSPIGATVTISGPAGGQTAQVITGDSFSSQHPATVHFGLGAAQTVDTLEIRWPNGAVRTLDRPAIDSYHTVSPPT
ncbi:MAG: CRTAC1 family protein [Gammaproteobacteria bacterium]|nr:CRTAC1 family protein [Gammaproteobacteria bacterium]